MNTLRCLGVDDEPYAREILADNIHRVPFLSNVGLFANPSDACPLIDTGQIDLLFLDIQLPSFTGMQFMRSLSNPPMVIFATAYEQYALEGYDLNVVDYLLKPIPFERFLRAATKARELFSLRQMGKSTQAMATSAQDRPSLTVFSEYKQVRLYHDEILYIEGLKDYVKIFTTRQSVPLLTRLNVKSMEARLPAQQFCRVHQSFIVSLDKITAFQKSRVLIGQQQIPVGRYFAEDFDRQFNHQRA